jgi:catechol 2,3-dioxygenase-like lactoylglutathione lyase family enzyme
VIEDFQHVCITCRDLERSIRFYETLGLKVVKRFGEVTAAGIATAFKLPSVRMNVVHLGLPAAASSMFIDLVQWSEPQSTGDAYPTLINIGLNRLAFRVSDIDATVAVLRASGVSFLSGEPQSFGPGYRGILMTDPDGVFVQLLEISQS